MDGTAPVAVQQSRPQRFGPSIPSRILIGALAAVCFGLACLLVLVGLVLAATSDDRTAGRDLVGSVVDGLLLVTLGVACRRLGRRAVVVDESGVTYVGFARTRRWTWSQIDGVEMFSVYDDEIGMVMAAVGLLDENPHPTEQEVRIGLEGNLCRCTGYHNIVQSVLAAAAK